MNQKSLLLIFVLLVNANLGVSQELVVCIPGCYPDNKVCKHCPDQCETCISDKNCTTCERNYYGQTCKLTCDVRCEGLCHKTHGYCTFSCRDGHYPVQDSPECYECPTNCSLCNSSSNCFSCQPGFYGPICEDVCLQNCTSSCHKDYGHCTYGCEDGTYHADNDTCLSCLSHCEVCRSATDCLRCKSGISVKETTRCDQLSVNTEDANLMPIYIALGPVVFIVVVVVLVIMKKRSKRMLQDTGGKKVDTDEELNSTALLGDADRPMTTAEVYRSNCGNSKDVITKPPSHKVMSEPAVPLPKSVMETFEINLA